MELLEEEFNQLDSIDCWNDKIIKIKELKDKINEEQNKVKDLIDKINNDEPLIYEVKKKKFKNLNLDELIIQFNKTEFLEDKMKYYDMINYYIKDIESQLFE